ncbi:MAG: restriction endonuclease subunit S [Synergistaceae bacterium]|nr:restriction endonuclease subunit S [Synergistaceae bacterium]
MKRYPEYKDSHIAWLGKIPSHWEIIRLKYTGSFRHGLTYSPADLSDNKGVLVLRSSNIQSNKLDFNDCVYVKNVSQDLMLKNGDIIICASNGNANLVGKCAYIDNNIVASFGSFMWRYRTNLLDKFAYYLLQVCIPPYKSLFTTSTINQLTAKTIGKIYIPLPPLSEQDKIARYLDYKVSRINKLISLRKKQLIDLAELKKVIINNSVTKGLNPNAELKQSGVDILGEIPAHWEISRIKRICKGIITGTTPPGVKEEFFSANGLAWYTPGDLGENLYINKAKKYLSTEGAKFVKVIPKNSVLMVGIGTIGKICVSDIECSTNQQINAIICDDNIINFKYLAFYLRAIKDYILYTAKSTTLPIINQSETKQIIIPLPPLSEQNQIAAYLDGICGKIDRLITLYEREISLFDELKARLISDCVTGQLDLRDIII